jgi:hypothetical protein
MDYATLSAAMDRTISRLKTDRDAAAHNVHWSFFGNLFGVSATASDWLPPISKAIAGLEDPGRREVLAGTRDFAQWNDEAAAIAQMIRAVDSSLEAWDFGPVTQRMGDSEAKAAGAVASAAAPYVVVALVFLLLILAIKVT